jgi:hypothetical protein
MADLAAAVAALAVQEVPMPEADVAVMGTLAEGMVPKKLDLVLVGLMLAEVAETTPVEEEEAQPDGE